MTFAAFGNWAAFGRPFFWPFVSLFRPILNLCKPLIFFLIVNVWHGACIFYAGAIPRLINSMKREN